MKHLLHWGSWALCVAVALPIYRAYGVGAYIAALAALIVVMLAQWSEGRMSVERNWKYWPGGRNE